MSLFKISDVEKATKTKSSLTSGYRNKLDLWRSIYAGQAPWNVAGVSQSGIDKAIAEELSRPIISELQIKTENKAIESALQKLNAESGTMVRHFVNLGADLVRPIFSDGKLSFELIPLGNYIPIARDFNGELTSAVICKTLENGKGRYLFSEKHEYKDRTHRIESRLYKMGESGGMENLREVSLESITQTRGVEPLVIWENIERPLIIEYMNRGGVNNIDGSGNPVALISGVEDMIKDADEQYDRLIWELKSTENKVFADLSMFEARQGANGNIERPVTITDGLKRLYVKLNGDPNVNEKLQFYSPSIRISEQSQALQEILKRIEVNTGIGKGTLSDLERTQQTATANTNGRKAYWTKVDAYETELEEKHHHTAYVFAYIASAYMGVPFDDEIFVTYDEADRKDPKEVRAQDLLEVQQGLMSKAEFRMKWYGEDEQTATLAIEKVKAETPQQSFNIFGE